jgi:hypothetical protein
VLPNVLCLLPPRQACERGNACLTCDKFATEQTYMDEHTQQLRRLGELIEHRCQAFRANTGPEMSDDNVWLSQRLKEQRALQKIIAALDHPDLDPDHAVRGTGTPARTQVDD